MIYSQYFSALQRLSKGSLPISDMSDDDLTQLFPHLSKEEITEVTTRQEIRAIACPPVKVRGALELVQYLKDSKSLYLGRPARTQESYVDDRFKASDIGKYEFSDRALAYAEQNWGDKLIPDSWESVLEIFIDDPSVLTTFRYPTRKACLYVALDRKYRDMTADKSKPLSILIDEAISQMTLDPVVKHELRGDRGGFMEFNCAYCGSGLMLKSCPGCGHEFADNQSRSGWRTPLSPKMVALLRENGHEFSVDPKQAWDAEFTRWEAESASN